MYFNKIMYRYMYLNLPWSRRWAPDRPTACASVRQTACAPAHGACAAGRRCRGFARSPPSATSGLRSSAAAAAEKKTGQSNQVTYCKLKRDSINMRLFWWRIAVIQTIIYMYVNSCWYWGYLKVNLCRCAVVTAYTCRACSTAETRCVCQGECCMHYFMIFSDFFAISVILVSSYYCKEAWLRLLV